MCLLLKILIFVNEGGEFEMLANLQSKLLNEDS